MTSERAPDSSRPRYDRAVLGEVVAEIGARLGDDVAAVASHALHDTLDHTITTYDDGTAFVITGDIPAMWLRDSTTQLTPYLHLLGADDLLADTVAAVSRGQQANILVDPYANAFNASADGAGHQDVTRRNPRVWERKYEVDSLAFPLVLAHTLWSRTGRVDHLDRFGEVARTIVALWRVEQDHEGSTYSFQRLDGPPSDTLTHDGRGGPVGRTGLTWSGFRPSDDACRYGYNVPGNALAAVALDAVAELAAGPLRDPLLAADAAALGRELRDAIRRHGVVRSAEGREIYAYEVDGLGHHLVMDDANQPGLLGLPLIGFCDLDDRLYQDTRHVVLSPENPSYFSGRHASGLGSPHTPHGYVWPIGLALEGLTTGDLDESHALLRTLLATDGGTGRMHESFDPDDPTVFTRPWFSWASAMFCELALHVAGLTDRSTTRPTTRTAPATAEETPW